MMGSKLGPVRRIQLSETVASELRRAILTGEFRAGEPMVETELAERLRVSRGPIREALRQLELESLVEVQPSGRTLVVGLSREGILGLYDARICLEKHALELAARQVTDTDVRRMEQIIDEMRTASSSGRHGVMADLDMTFHREFFAIAGNRVLAQLWEVLNPQIRSLLEITDIINPRVASITEKHQRILDGLARRDGQAAQAALVSHLEEAQQILLGRMEQRHFIEPAATPDNGSSRAAGGS